jgi:membrane protein YqaA with SNARE-associated domain
MDACSHSSQGAPGAGAFGPDDVSVRWWFAAYATGLAAACALLAVLAAGQDQGFSAWLEHPVAAFTDSRAAVKLLGFAVYLSLCCTFLPLPTGWAVAAVATRQAAVTQDVFSTTLLAAACGAIGSTLANLNDYHLFTWLLRRRRIAAVRQTRAHRLAGEWFAKAPFAILVVFNILPIPIDVIRMLATSCRYGRAPFAAANFAGRFIRYGVIAYATYRWDLGWAAVVILLILAVAVGLLRTLGGLLRKPLAQREAGPSR